MESFLCIMARPSRTRAGTAFTEPVGGSAEQRKSCSLQSGTDNFCIAGITSQPSVSVHSGAQVTESRAGQGWGQNRALSCWFWRAARTETIPLGCMDLVICFTFYSFMPFPPLSPSQVLFLAIPKYAACQGLQLPYWLHFADLDLYLIITTWLSYPFLLERQRNTVTPYPPCLTLQYSAFACCSLVQVTTGHQLHIQDFPFLISVLKPFVVSPSQCCRWAVATCKPLDNFISISLGGTPSFCTCYHVSPGTKSTFSTLKCSTIILIFNSFPLIL